MAPSKVVGDLQIGDKNDEKDPLNHLDVTPRKFNIAPKNRQSQKERRKSSSPIHFQVFF